MHSSLSGMSHAMYSKEDCSGQVRFKLKKVNVEDQHDKLANVDVNNAGFKKCFEEENAFDTLAGPLAYKQCVLVSNCVCLFVCLQENSFHRCINDCCLPLRGGLAALRAGSLTLIELSHRFGY